ncbi:hypothetical protein EV644_12343 [Kribbella orskensis]|uniref:Transmembrane protein n=1 Tax=Kribbella orskensis TaxID=2512216 RepID=A0ABY2BAC2_9ACTN|nr:MULTISPECIES: hypothetical protein [Kribbella]TCN32915.1 hypothetical protein EV642_12580 [Kribbella sp. VKM Ac-2500]TCO13211.1 hypothetical protein EV644_12343 [Kribbella orskensis]
MRAYRIFWLFFCGVLGALGTVAACTWSLSTVMLLFICASLTGGVAAMVVLDPDRETRLPRDSRRIVAVSSILAGAGTMAFIGVGTLVGGPMAVLLLAITAAGSPYTIDYCLRWLREHGHLPSPSPQPNPPDPAERSAGSAPAPTSWIEPGEEAKPHVSPASLSDDALCLAWRASFSALQRAGSPAQRLWIVDERRAYLEELENRNARGIAAWLASGARAAGDPSRFVLGDSVPGHPPIDWDGLIHGPDN